MTYDDLSILSTFSQAHVLPYPLLGDEQAKHVTAFDILNKDYEPGHRAYGIPHPGIMYLDAEQIIQAKFADQGYKRRPALEAVYEQLKATVEK